MALVIQQYVVWLYVSVNNSLLVNVPQRATELCNPKSNRLFCKSLSGDVKAEITTCHEIDNNVSEVTCQPWSDSQYACGSYKYSTSWKL